jgi:hypothetical protein
VHSSRASGIHSNPNSLPLQGRLSIPDLPLPLIWEVPWWKSFGPANRILFHTELSGQYPGIDKEPIRIFWDLPDSRDAGVQQAWAFEVVLGGQVSAAPAPLPRSISVHLDLLLLVVLAVVLTTLVSKLSFPDIYRLLSLPCRVPI